ncbi:hypothetical protein FRB90_002819 [Tulasnella sp. 427]|nr:hypothetical protein FRB90_002819 [Tulasnella sp. 427]
MSGEPLSSLMFEGRHAVECEDFIGAVQRYTFAQGKPVDDRWVAQFASSCFTRDALRWWSNLDDEVQSSWKLLRKAMLDRYQPLFQGTSGEEAEYFVRMVSQRALDEGKYSDFTWAAAFASACLDGDALRWWSSLPPNVKNDWNILRQAILHQYPTIPKRLIPTPAAAAPPPAPLWKPTLRGRVLVTIDGDPTIYYISKQVSPGSFTVLTSLVSLALEVGCEYGRLENAILFIPPGQLPSFDSLGIHWAGYDLASPVK